MAKVTDIEKNLVAASVSNRLAVARWVVVIAGLTYGVWQTVLKASALFSR